LEVMAFLVNRNLHYSFVKTKGFKHFDAVSNPQFNIRSTNSMSKRMSGLLSNNLIKAMAFVLETELNVAFTYSEWTPNNIQLSFHYPSTTSTKSLSFVKSLLVSTTF